MRASALNSSDALLAIRQRANPRLAILRSNETLKRVSNVGRRGEIPRWIAERPEKDEGPSYPDTFLSCRSYVNPRCFFAALLIIDHLITIHYTPPSPPPSSPSFLLERTVGGHYSCTERSGIETDRKREKETGWGSRRERETFSFRRARRRTAICI